MSSSAGLVRGRGRRGGGRPSSVGELLKLRRPKPWWPPRCDQGSEELKHAKGRPENSGGASIVGGGRRGVPPSIGLLLQLWRPNKGRGAGSTVLKQAVQGEENGGLHASVLSVGHSSRAHMSWASDESARSCLGRREPLNPLIAAEISASACCLDN